VAEEDNKVVFLRRIVPGGSDKSYGVQVAQLAGLPQGVINRAWEVLADLERSNGAVKSSGSRRPRQAEGHQMSLFNPAQPLMDEIQSLDIPNLTPLEAINLLYELQRKANEVAPPESAA
jgi:DNA mismatch repair protein MutS